MTGDFTVVYSVRFDCTPTPLEPLCHLPLPHHSPLGAYEGSHYRPTDAWPATFLCLRHGLACERSPQEIQSDLEVRTPGAPVPPMWRIACTCAHQNCGKRHTIYAARLPGFPEVARRILKLAPRIPCGDHLLECRIDLMRGAVFGHD